MPSEQITVPSQRDTKVPGLMPPLKDKATHITDLAKYSVPELTELRDRQKHMLANKYNCAFFFCIAIIDNVINLRSILKVLSDKGQRIQSLYNRILAELENRDEMSKAVSNFSELNIAENGKEAIANMEWHGKLEAFVHTKRIVSNDDPDETDPLKLLAQSRHSTRIVKVEDASADDVVSLITAADLEEIRSFKPEPTTVDTAVSDTLEPHALYMCSIERRHLNEVHREKFLPHKTTTSDVHSVTQEKKRQLAGGKHWENTAATPPPLRNGEVIALTLQDSIANQRRQIDLVKVYKRKLKLCYRINDVEYVLFSVNRTKPSRTSSAGPRPIVRQGTRRNVPVGRSGQSGRIQNVSRCGLGARRPRRVGGRGRRGRAGER